MLGIVASASFPLAMWLLGINGVVVMVALFIIVLLVWYVFWLHARIVDVAVSLFGAFYTGLLMSAAMLIRMSVPDYWGGVLILGIFASVWGNDAFAYLIGSKFGKHKMTPAGLTEENGKASSPASSFPWHSGACSRSFLGSR